LHEPSSECQTGVAAPVDRHLAVVSRRFSNKADVLFAEPYFAYEYLKSNPGTVKNIAVEKPIRALGNCYMFKKGEFQYKQMLDVAIEDLLNSGFVDDLLKKYEPAPNTFYRVAKTLSRQVALTDGATVGNASVVAEVVGLAVPCHIHGAFDNEHFPDSDNVSRRVPARTLGDAEDMPLGLG